MVKTNIMISNKLILGVKLCKTTLFLLICFMHVKTWACTCVGENTIQEEIKQSDYIFAGKIISKNIFIVNDTNLPSGFLMKQVEYTILAVKIYKGKTSNDTIRLVTGLGNGDCGYEFAVGLKYIIYSVYYNKYFAHGNNVAPFLYTNICTRTKRIHNKELKKLKRYFKMT